MSFEEMLSERVKAVERILAVYLPKEEGCQKTVLEAMNYSILAGGKRLRPVLMKETYVLFNGKGRIIEPFMAALEMIHNYSLVHDDLPAMDNDEYRRGRETTWKIYGDGMAVLAGDALLNYAFETASEAFNLVLAESGYLKDPFRAADAVRLYQSVSSALSVLARKAGVYGMIGGQCADLEAEKLPCGEVSEKLLYFIQKNKTAALIESAMMIGAILAGASAQDVARMEKAAENIGLAFQIQDDILDVTSSLEELGKQTGSDEKNNKATYVGLKGLKQAEEDVAALSGEALELLRKGPSRNEFLEQLVENLISRRK